MTEQRTVENLAADLAWITSEASREQTARRIFRAHVPGAAQQPAEFRDAMAMYVDEWGCAQAARLCCEMARVPGVRTPTETRNARLLEHVTSCVEPWCSAIRDAGMVVVEVPDPAAAAAKGPQIHFDLVQPQAAAPPIIHVARCPRCGYGS